MSTKNRTECSILEPAYKQFLIILFRGISSRITTNIRSPIRNSGCCKVQTCCNLFLKFLKCCWNIPRPYCSSPLLLRSPRTTSQHIRTKIWTSFCYSIIKMRRMHQWIYIPHSTSLSCIRTKW